MEAALKAIAEPRRRAILRLVKDTELTAGEIASAFDVTRPAISQHLGVLKEAGLVRERRMGTRRFYRARPETVRELQRFLQDFWTDELQRLKVVVEREVGVRGSSAVVRPSGATGRGAPSMRSPDQERRKRRGSK